MTLLRPALAAAMLACTGASAAEPSLQEIAVTATRDPVDKSYRKILKGMDVFERQCGLAPNASLRFKLLFSQYGTNMDGITLEILGDSFMIPVTVAPDRTFTLPRLQKALDEDASVRPNRRADSLTWRTDIRTPGLPPHTRRLGDLRLECLVGMEADLVSNVIPVIGQISKLIDSMVGYCDKPDPHYYFFSERPLFSVTMTAGARRTILPLSELYAGASVDPLSASDLAHCDCQVLLDRTYYMPLGDRSWPDDTLIEIEYMDGGP